MVFRKGQVGRGLAAMISLFIVFVLMLFGNLAASAMTITGDKPGRIVSNEVTLRNIEYDFLFQKFDLLGEEVNLFEAFSVYANGSLISNESISKFNSAVNEVLVNKGNVYFEKGTCLLVYLSSEIPMDLSSLEQEKSLFFKFTEDDSSLINDFSEFKEYVRSNLLVSLPEYEFTYKEVRVKSSISYYYGSCKEF